jgi:hypothetical protein
MRSFSGPMPRRGDSSSVQRVYLSGSGSPIFERSGTPAVEAVDGHGY